MFSEELRWPETFMTNWLPLMISSFSFIGEILMLYVNHTKSIVEERIVLFSEAKITLWESRKSVSFLLFRFVISLFLFFLFLNSVNLSSRRGRLKVWRSFRRNRQKLTVENRCINDDRYNNERRQVITMSGRNRNRCNKQKKHNISFYAKCVYVKLFKRRLLRHYIYYNDVSVTMQSL